MSKRVSLAFDDIKMSVRFRTHCRGCGLLFQVEAIHLDANPYAFKHTVESMRNQLEAADCPTCKKRLPKIGTEWSDLW